MGQREYSYDEYERALEKILDCALRDYWVQYVDINSHQVGVAKTYLWVSAALMGGYAGVVRLLGFENIDYSIFSIALGAIGGLLAVVAFGYCLYAIPERSGYRVIAPNIWGQYSLNAHSHLGKKDPNLYISTLSELIDNTDSGIYHNLNTNKKRASRLRITSWLLIGSFLTSSVAIGAVVSENYAVITSNTEATMSDENEQSGGSGNQEPAQGGEGSQDTSQGAGGASQSSSGGQDSGGDAGPQVPTPQGPLGGDSNVQTHNVDSDRTKTINTEDRNRDSSGDE